MTSLHDLRVPGYVFGFCVSWYVCLIVHELGHAFAAIIVGMSIEGLEIGPVKLRRRACEEGTSSLQFRWQWIRPTGGLTRTRFRAVSLSRPAMRYLIMVGGGPAANVLLGLIAIAVQTKTTGVQSLTMGLLAITSAAVAGATLYPTRGKRFDSDGRRILDLLFDPSLRDCYVAKACYVERLRLFKTAFRSGATTEASGHLAQMRKACRTDKDRVLLAIVNHLEEHVVSGESVDDCKWSPVTEKGG